MRCAGPSSIAEGPRTSGSLRQPRACGRLTVEIEPPVFWAVGKVLRFLYLCQVRPRLPCCAIVGLISRGASILPVLAPRGGDKEYDDTHQ
jgi:hypothetical protein